ncbi:MAG TPA: HAD hydrolase family protein [Streptosporangiaceae bacterium]|nr:HAD hydrolase family protein [Streptosporangiaceae bacterium]
MSASQQSVTGTADRGAGGRRLATVSPTPGSTATARAAVQRQGACLLARSLQVPEAEFLPRIARIVGGRAEVTQSGLGGLAEIGPLGVTKASSLAEWCAGRGISASEVWAFGDRPTDLPMLTWAGLSFAVANAHPDVVAAANQCCPSNAEDAVASVLESLLAAAPKTMTKPLELRDPARYVKVRAWTPASAAGGPACLRGPDGP